MKPIALAAIGLMAVALSACASRYNDGYYDRYGYYHSYRGHYEYTDRDRAYDPTYRSRDYDDSRPYYRDRY